MISEDQRNVQHDENTLIAVLPPLGRHSNWGSILGYLKIASRRTFEIHSSVLEFVNANGELLEKREAAFGQQPGTKHSGPYSIRFSDDTRRPAGADRVYWRVNEMIVEAGLSGREDVGLRVMYLPLQVQIDRDPHIVITVVNRTTKVLNIADGIRSAICYADGQAYCSNRGGHWDGGVGLNPGYSTTRQLSLDDFPGIPRAGHHEMSIELLGLRSKPEYVDWLPANG